MVSMLALKLSAATDTVSPNEPIPKPECDANATVSIRYSSTSQRLYLESADGTTRGGCVTLNDIWVERGGKAPLYAVDAETGAVSTNATGTWLLTEELYIEDGITLQVKAEIHVTSSHVRLSTRTCSIAVQDTSQEREAPSRAVFLLGGGRSVLPSECSGSRFCYFPGNVKLYFAVLVFNSGGGERGGGGPSKGGGALDQYDRLVEGI